MGERAAVCWNASGGRGAPQRGMSLLFIPAVRSSVAGSSKSTLILTASKFSYLDFDYHWLVGWFFSSARK